MNVKVKFQCQACGMEVFGTMSDDFPSTSGCRRTPAGIHIWKMIVIHDA